MTKKDAPSLRYKEFTDTWKQCELGKVTDIFDGTHQTPRYTNSGVKFVSVENIDTLETNKYISKEAYDKEYLNKQAEKGDVLMTRIGDIGTSKVIETDELLAYYVTLALLKPKELDSDFLAQIISSPTVQNNIWRRTLHIAFPKKINLSEINQIELVVPTSGEQIKIGKLFANLDQSIIFHQRKLNKLKQIKKSLLQQIFPQLDSSKPQLRLGNFSENWKSYKLGELADIMGGGTPSTEKEEYWNGNIDWYSPVEIGKYIFVSESVNKITELGLQKSSARILPIGTVLFTSRAGIGKTAILAKEGTTNQGFQSIIPKKGKLDSYFIYSRTDELKVYGEATGAGSTFVEVSGKQMAKMTILVPSIEEQIEIGNFFKQLDQTIAAQQRKYEKLKQVKTALLQEMFV